MTKIPKKSKYDHGLYQFQITAIWLLADNLDGQGQPENIRKIECLQTAL